ncbi:MAG: EAL domain-containing protein [Nitrospirota bacterium]
MNHFKNQEIKLSGSSTFTNGRELFLIAMALGAAFAFILISLTVDFSSNIYHVITVLWGLTLTRAVINGIFLFLVSALFILYRRWKLSESKKRELEDVIQSVNPYALLVIDSNTRVVMCNRVASTLLGYDISEIIHNNINLFLSDAHSSVDLPNICETIKRDDFCVGEVAGKRKNGSLVSLEIIGGGLKHYAGAVILLRDITDRKKNKESLLMLQKAIANMQIGVTITDKQGKILHVNPADAAMHGYSVEELIGQDVRIFGLPKDRNPLSEEQLKSLKRFRRESVNVRQDGSTFPVQLMSDVVTNTDGEVIALITTCEDITDRKRNEEIIKQSAYYDVLTGLPNRKLFKDLMGRELAKARRNSRGLAVMFIDLDRFKVINDTLGHSTGDELLKSIAQRLTNTLRESDIISRFGGDEFLVLIPEVTDPRSAALIAVKINKTLSKVFMFGENEIYVTASVGISLFPSSGSDMETLIRNADCAMYQAKKQGKNTYQFYNPNFSAGSMEKLSLEMSIRKSLRQKEFLLYYQPQIDLNNGMTIGAEALLRWQNNKGSISPKQLISVAEETDLIVPLGEWILRTACEQNVMWQEKGLPPIRVSVNVSMLQFTRKNFVRMLSRIVEETGANPANLELELTESIIMRDVDYTSSVMGELKSLGIGLAIDDFGTGYSSLNYLKLLPLDRLKIDQSFISALTTSSNDYSICKAIIVMAHSLDLRVLAEGVENDRQLAFLRTLNCDEAQGFLFGKPMTEEEFIRLMLSRREGRTIQALSPYQNHIFHIDPKNADISLASANSLNGQKLFEPENKRSVAGCPWGGSRGRRALEQQQ